MAKKLIIGREDRIDFPQLDLFNIACKTDTGAYTSSIHCRNVYLVEQSDGQSFLRFQLLDPEHDFYNDKEYECSDFKKRIIKSSFGTQEERWSIQSTVVLFGQSFPINLTLADRETMRYPVLLGCRFLARNRILVDVTRKKISYKAKQKLIKDIK